MRLPAPSFAAVLAAIVTLSAGPVSAQVKLEDVNPRDPRRTPVVEVFHRWNPAVVYLTGPLATGDGPAIDEFFHVATQREIVSIGSGFVVQESGYVVTNAHAVERVITHHAALVDGQTYAADLIGIAREYDLALLKVQAGRPLKAVRLGKSSDFLLGETIVVISNPAGLLHTCTSGIISAANRESLTGGLPGIVLRNLIQTDAPLNPGSSGGPWFNVLGEVIGVTTAMKVGVQNVGFGIPVAAVRRVLPDMLDVERRYGIDTGFTTQEQPQEPCVIADVARNSTADAAGIRPGDVIKVVNGQTIVGRLEFLFALVDRKPGDVLHLTLSRGEQSLDVSLPLLPRPKVDGAAILRQRYGLNAIPLSEAKADAASLRVHRGVVITAVAQAAYARMQMPPIPGDVLARINGVRPRNLEDVGLLLERIKPGQPAHFVLLRVKGSLATRVDMTITLRK